jgi:SpoVK/Ycf46/Vps4 family AAA+-type ATPase
MDESSELKSDLAQLARLALSEQLEDARLFVARLIRKYRSVDPAFTEKLDLFLQAKQTRSASVLRKATVRPRPDQALPVDEESRLSLLRVYSDRPGEQAPLLTGGLEESLTQLVQERREAKKLASHGLVPSRSAIFVGPPGVGKTLTARWLAAELGVPLYVLDLTAVMSSLLGKSGNNLRAALDFAKRSPCVLLLDEIDAIAKRRGDEGDVGELKRLVTVILQEVDEWPVSGLLLAATNHPELIDPALWRRFDLVIEFKVPDAAVVKTALKRFLGPEYALFAQWMDILAYAFKGFSFSDIEREIQRFRRALALGAATDAELVEEFLKTRALSLDRASRIDLAVQLAKKTRLSQHTISEVTGVSRDTIRKYSSDKKPSRGSAES